MKAGIFAVAAAMATGVSAGTHHAARRHQHEAFHLERGLTTGTGSSPNATCGCTTVYYTITGEGVLHTPSPVYSSMALPSPSPVTTPAAVVVPASTLPATVPTAFVTTCPTPGVYTIPATTITLTEEVTVCAPASTTAHSGTNVAGGVVTVIATSTTVVCPYATVSTSGSVVTSVIETTTTVCPTAGTYTIAPLTTVCEVETVWVYPTPTSYAPGVYTQAELIVTVTETDFVVFCPYATSAPAVVVPAPVPTSAAPVAPVISATPVPASGSSSGSSSSGLGTSGKQWAVVYSPFQPNDQCKGKDDIYNDIQTIAGKGFTAVRVYGTVCSSLEYIGGACEQYGIKMILGIFIDVTGIQGAQCQEQVTEIAAWAKWELVELMVIGNEAIFNGWCTAEELAAFIETCKSTFSYSGPYTTAEPLNIWQESATTSSLCSIIEYVGCNIHPFFNADISSSQAGSFVASQLQIVDGLCPGLTGVNLETGWPSFSDPCNGAACGTTTDQAIAIQGIADNAGGISVILSYANDLWKDVGDFECEQSWGAIQLYPITA